jgi:hypothetical protein
MMVAFCARIEGSRRSSSTECFFVTMQTPKSSQFLISPFTDRLRQFSKLVDVVFTVKQQIIIKSFLLPSSFDRLTLHHSKLFRCTPKRSENVLRESGYMMSGEFFAEIRLPDRNVTSTTENATEVIHCG